MNERPILFSGPMVRAIMEDRKWKTRRVVKPQPELYKQPGSVFGNAQLVRWGEKVDTPLVLFPTCMTFRDMCPYGNTGDHLWVRETWRRYLRENRTAYRADGEEDVTPLLTWRPSIFMPRQYCRLVLEITDLRVERLHEINEADIKAEGSQRVRYRGYTSAKIDDPDDLSDAWDAMNARRGYNWASNPWVWVITFKKVQS